MSSTPLDLQKLISHVQDVSPDASPTSLLAAAVSVATETASVADDLVVHFVGRARRAGSSWADIGLALGVTRQAAQQRFATGPASAQTACELSPPLTPPARRALREARREAGRTGDGVGVEQLLAALVRDPRVLAVKILHGVGADPEEVMSTLQRPSARTRAGRDSNTGSDTVLRVLHRAAAEATSHGHNYIGTEHLLLAMLAEPSPARDTLAACGVDYDCARAKALELLTAPRLGARRRRLRMG